jgi:hypothetical protein
MSSVTQFNERRFCLDCKSFLPNERFKLGSRRTICKMHYNQRMVAIQAHRWVERPQERHAKIIWQVSYIDSIKTFKQKINLTPSALFCLLRDLKITETASVRLVPVNPFEPLSTKNFCLTSTTNRKDMCNVWKRLQCKKTYCMFLDPQVVRQIYATSNCEESE